MCTNMPYSAIQAILDDEHDVFIGNGIATFATLAGGAIGISIGENILVSKLISEVPTHTGTIPPKAVIASGALNLGTLTSSPGVLYGLRQAYVVAISAIMICATVTICVSILATVGMQPLNLKNISRARELAKEAQGVASSSGTVVGEGGEKEVPLVEPQEAACTGP
ncbi:hypothetical protein N7G274_005432 [Stereocaulon virgatum]|uniref:Uncharacterized protein n=1 Tax=Stereocaulon virgatum TaxID=373712 RepID=A0ABR4AE41_9LECA